MHQTSLEERTFAKGDGTAQKTSPLQNSQISTSDSLLHSESLKQTLGQDAMQILRCGICMEFFDVPIVLPCGHTFCLRCLTEMCKHASHGNILTSLSELRIGCPNCRVLIYASPILDRNVTCNFTIQSLIETLRNRTNVQTSCKAVNTTEVRQGEKIKSLTDINITEILADLDRLTETLGQRTIVDQAYFEIDAIRREYNKTEDKLVNSDTCTNQHDIDAPDKWMINRESKPSMSATQQPSLTNIAQQFRQNNVAKTLQQQRSMSYHNIQQHVAQQQQQQEQQQQQHHQQQQQQQKQQLQQHHQQQQQQVFQCNPCDAFSQTILGLAPILQAQSRQQQQQHKKQQQEQKQQKQHQQQYQKQQQHNFANQLQTKTNSFQNQNQQGASNQGKFGNQSTSNKKYQQHFNQVQHQQHHLNQVQLQYLQQQQQYNYQLQQQKQQQNFSRQETQGVAARATTAGHNTQITTQDGVVRNDVKGHSKTSVRSNVRPSGGLDVDPAIMSYTYKL